MDIEKDFEYWFANLYHNYNHDEIASSSFPPDKRERILGDYEIVLSKIESTIGTARLKKLRERLPEMEEKYKLLNNSEHYVEKPGLVFKKMLDELKKEHDRLDRVRTENFVKDLGELLARYSIAEVEELKVNEADNAIDVIFENRKMGRMPLHISPFAECPELEILKNLGEGLDKAKIVQDPCYIKEQTDEDIELA